MKSVLVLMSTYNGEKYLRDQLNSIFNQKNVGVKILVRDDGSSDGTIDILEEYAQNNNLTYYIGKNIGWKDSFWMLVNMANGFEYYAFADQDDIWDEDKLARAVTKLEEYIDVPAIYCANQRIVDEDLNIMSSVEDEVDVCDFKWQDFLVRGNLFRGCTEVWNHQLQEYILCKNIKHIDDPHDAFIFHIGLAIGSVTKDNAEVMSYRQHADNVLGIVSKKKKYLKKVRTFLLLFKKNHDMQKKVYSSRVKRIYSIVKNDLTEEKKYFYKQICKYDQSYVNTVNLAFSRNYPNMTLSKRIQILLRIF